MLDLELHLELVSCPRMRRHEPWRRAERHDVPSERLLPREISEGLVGVEVVVHGPLGLARDELGLAQQKGEGRVEVPDEERRTLADEQVDSDTVDGAAAVEVSAPATTSALERNREESRRFYQSQQLGSRLLPPSASSRAQRLLACTSRAAGMATTPRWPVGVGGHHRASNAPSRRPRSKSEARQGRWTRLGATESETCDDVEALSGQGGANAQTVQAEGRSQIAVHEEDRCSEGEVIVEDEWQQQRRRQRQPPPAAGMLATVGGQLD